MIQYLRTFAATHPRKTRIGAAGAGAVLLLALFLFGWFSSQVDTAPGTGSVTLVADFSKGMSLRRFADGLEKGKILGSARIFVLYARFKGADSRVQAGTYRFTDGMKPAEILRMMVDGEVFERNFALPEGYSIYQAAELLQSKGFFKKDEFLRECSNRPLLKELGIGSDSVEGYLFPGTYNLVKVNDPQTLLRAMGSQFRKMYEERFANAEKGSRLTRHQIITLASMVEKEAVSPAEKPLIASVFHNRLRVGMPLQSDPTAVYGVRAFAGKVSKADVERESRYNTYRIKGLPPGPIGNPSESAIAAVLNPAKTGYYYFVAKNDGTHHFSVSLTEHNQAVNRYLKQGGTGRQSSLAPTQITNDRTNITGRR